MKPQMESDTEKHRRSIRLKYRDYALPGPYFVTICAHEKRCVFGSIVGARLAPSELGQLVRECWVAIPIHFPQVTHYEFGIMPNHLHGIVAIERLVGAQQRCALPAHELKKAVEAGSRGAIVRSFKAIVARRAHKELQWNGPVWQRNYYERVLRDGQEFSDASRYIAENPMKWEWDRENPQLDKR
jgi:REP-associated tyrosine transposase